ncbi:MAG TPA: hypothetical protein VNM47_01080 [Terriglobia bacterium]|nr:hypothetical protein [Terriglobia bacterium]
MRIALQISAARTVVVSALERNLRNPEPSEQVMMDHYRCPQEFVRVGVQGNLSEQAGFFKFGSESVCYGRASAFTPSPEAGQILNDALKYARGSQDGIHLPFDVAETVTALRYEKYTRNGNGAQKSSILQRSVRAAYYAIRPVMPVSVRKHLRHRILQLLQEDSGSGVRCR